MLKTSLKPNNVRHQENKIGQGFQMETPKQFFSVGIGVGDRSRDCDVTVVVSTLVSIRSGEDYVDVSDGILSSAPPAQGNLSHSLNRFLFLF